MERVKGIEPSSSAWKDFALSVYVRRLPLVDHWLAAGQPVPRLGKRRDPVQLALAPARSRLFAWDDDQGPRRDVADVLEKDNGWLQAAIPLWGDLWEHPIFST